MPATLHNSLMSRLDRLPEVKSVAQVAACIGRNFDYRTLAAVAGMAEPELNSALDRLVEAELVFRRGRSPNPAYTFKHALVRDAAANSLLRSEFRRVNASIAAAFEAFEIEPPPELIAWHAELAGQDRKAVDYLLLAGSRASGRYANQEAIHHLERALRLIAALPEEAEQAALELRALAMVGVPRIALHGYASKEVEATYRRTVELAERAGDTAQLFQGLRGLWNCIYDRADSRMPVRSPNGSVRWRSITRKRKPRGWPIARWAPPVSASAGSTKPSPPSRRASRPAQACRLTRVCASTAKSPLIIAGIYAGFSHTIAGDFDRGQAFIDEALGAVRRLQNPLSLRLCPSHRGKHPVPVGRTGGMRPALREVLRASPRNIA